MMNRRWKYESPRTRGMRCSTQHCRCVATADHLVLADQDEFRINGIARTGWSLQ
jgi:hypothetical protein